MEPCAPRRKVPSRGSTLQAVLSKHTFCTHHRFLLIVEQGRLYQHPSRRGTYRLQ
eukprot:m.135602 g.135602  ORF g.135602 m.135602 type:complete len:55 (+) comp22609_c0_seq1:912-1076(+)